MWPAVDHCCSNAPFEAPPKTFVRRSFLSTLPPLPPSTTFKWAFCAAFISGLFDATTCRLSNYLSSHDEQSLRQQPTAVMFNNYHCVRELHLHEFTARPLCKYTPTAPCLLAHLPDPTYYTPLFLAEFKTPRLYIYTMIWVTWGVGA